MFLTWLPIVGPIIQGLVDIFKQKTDTDLKRQIDNNKTSVDIIETRAEIVKAFRYDLGTLLTRDLIMFPVALHTAFVAYYSIFHNLYPSETWIILDWPQGMQYIPYAVIAYLFATDWKGK